MTLYNFNLSNLILIFFEICVHKGVHFQDSLTKNIWESKYDSYEIQQYVLADTIVGQKPEWQAHICF